MRRHYKSLIISTLKRRNNVILWFIKSLLKLLIINQSAYFSKLNYTNTYYVQKYSTLNIYITYTKFKCFVLITNVFCWNLLFLRFFRCIIQIILRFTNVFFANAMTSMIIYKIFVDKKSCIMCVWILTQSKCIYKIF